jgi:hypothetical protein
MQKDPGRRLHHIADARLDIEDAIRESSELPASHPGDRRPSALLARALPWAIAAIALGVIAWMLASTRAAPGGIGLVRLELNPPSGVELYTASARTVGVSPDGSRIAFVGVLSGGRQVYVRSLDQLEAVPVRGSENATGFVFSPEGESIGVVDAGGVLKTIRLSDGTMTTVTREVSILYGAAWGRDERIVFVRDGALWRVPSSGGTPEALTALATDTLHAWPFVIGNGEAILFGAASGDDWRIDAVVPATGERRTIVERGRLPLHAASGHLLFFRDGELLAAPFDTDRLEVTGLAVRTINSLPAIASGIPPLDVSASGTLVYSPMTSNSTVVWVSRSGAEQSLNTTLRPYTNPRLRGDGTALLVQAGDLWIQDLTRSTFTRLAASDAVLNGFPIWTTDGTRVVYKITTALRVQDADGSDSRVIDGTTGFDFPASVTPDGETLIFMRSSEATSFDIYTVPLRGGERPKPSLTTRAYEGGGRLSPDGRWLIYVSNESGQNEVYLRQFPGPERRWQVSTEGGTQAAWNANGREIFYRDGDRMMAVEVSTTQSVVLSPPRVLFVQRYAYGAGITIANYDVTPDGARFVMIKDESTAGRLNIVLNWFEELKRLVPGN